MLARFLNHFFMRLVSKLLQTVKLLVKAADPSSHRWRIDLRQPVFPFPRPIYLLPSTTNRPASECSLQPVLCSCCVAYQLLVRVYQLFKSPRPTLSVIHRVELTQSKQSRQLPCVDSISFVSTLDQFVPTRVTHNYLFN